MRIIRLAMLCGAAIWFLLADAAMQAAEEHLRFLHALQHRGYGDVAVIYVEQLSARSDLPDDIRQVLDLERCNSLRLAAEDAYNADEAKRLLDEAEKYLEKFLAEHPDHPEVGTALLASGEFSLDRAQQRIGQAMAMADKRAREAALVEARDMLQKARVPLTDAFRRYQARFKSLPPPQAPQSTNRQELQAYERAVAAREEVELGLVESQYKVAMVDYYLAQTYDDPKSETRRAILGQAAKEFDIIYQAYRGFEAGVLAHTWHGKAVEDLGDQQLALDIYDEVLTNSPEPGEASEDQAAMFAQVQLFRLRLLLKKSGAPVFFAEAEAWLQSHRGWQRVPGYNGIALEVAKAKLELSKKADVNEKRRLAREVLIALTAIGKNESEYKSEALRLRRELLSSSGSTAEITAGESEALGDAAAEEGNWEEAYTAYQEAIKKADPKQTDTLAGIRRKLRQVRYNRAIGMYQAGKMSEAYQEAGAVAREDLTDPVAAAAASVAVSAALGQYVAAQDKSAALKQLENVADFTVKQWPGQPEADEARLALGQASLVRGETDGAIAVFEKVNPQSKRYPWALHLAGQTYFKRYLEEKQRPEAERDQERMKKDFTTAEERLVASLDAQRKELKPGEPMPRPLYETQLLLGEVTLEAQKTDEAIALLDPLVDELKRQKSDSIDTVVLRTYVAAVRAHVAKDEMDRAGAVAEQLLEAGADNALVNTVLIDFSKLLGAEVKKAEAASIEADSGDDDSAKATAQARLGAAQGFYGKLLGQLSQRQELSLAGMVYLGDACASIGMTEQARQQYQRIIDRTEKDADFRASAGKALTRVRSQLAGLLRADEKYEEAMQQIEELLKSHPTALEPLMEKGRIMQGWAMKEPARFADCVAHWTDLRMKMARMSPKPAAYYEVIYNAAFCLTGQSLVTKDRSKAQQAEQLLKSTKALSPALSGPDMVAKYDALLKKVKIAQAQATQ